MNRALGVLLVLLFCMSAMPQNPGESRLTKVGGIAGEAGMFASSNRLITIHSDGSIRAQFGANGKWQVIDHSGPVSFELKGDAMRKSQDSVPLAVAHDFGFCDALNQVDISSTIDKGLRSTLPKNARVKATESIRDKLTLLVYASGSDSVRYPLRLALVQNDGEHKYSVVGEDSISTDGNYCGMQSLVGGYRVILVDEPAGSSDFSAAYVYMLRP
jgi:hypothetical protein